MIFHCEFQKLSSDSLAFKKTVYIKLLYTMAFYMNQAFDEFIVINPDAVQKTGGYLYIPELQIIPGGCRMKIYRHEKSNDNSSFL